MHKYERIGLWSLMIVLLVIVLFRPRISGYSPVGLSFNLMDAQEFRSMPAELKALYSTNVPKVTDALCRKISSDWAKASTPNKNGFKTMITQYADSLANNINASRDLNQALASLSSAGNSMMASAGSPPTKPQTTKSGYEMDNLFGMGSPSEEQPQPDYQEEGYMYMIR